MRYLPTLLLLAATPVIAGAAPAKTPAPRTHGTSEIFDHVAAQRAAGNANASRATGPARLAPVPEPAIWSMMIAGIGFAGAALRRTARRPRTLAAGIDGPCRPRR
ncbi:PEPxxWA-CTERM sorting domain-containing protein [Sphingomonas sp. JC676]|uniref:PEPxxWA-CTERM sorting domain-containing protein n=1 Tax=Sphingomonas sp. JC676 TaxID=2768065 RepID=UPI0016584BC9|nr:PEPxxWA-CTERM sorting domain-containing protein [Sphingomonas sp. JC676]MBC9031017.1 PEPxxWA-CTERM sorting domain-containing protein [Sphingomonas sp. JC676]